MAYQVLYRKYRPVAFRDVVGQPQITITLQNELMAGRISHAYLFTGTRGTGKTTCAKILAKAVNCLASQQGDPCGQCANCKGIDSGAVMDVMEIDAASNNGVDSIRALIEEAAFTPSSAKYRVYIIDEVHMLSDAAFNALLKTLEEPPAHVIFILATTEVHKLLATIISRCQRFDFKRITGADIAQRLTQICQMEGATVEQEAALLIARLADGGMRDAISLLDQCLGRGTHVTLQTVEDTAGVVGSDHLFTLAGAVIDSDSALALETIHSLYENSKDMSRLCEELATHFRNLMLIKTMGDKPGMIAGGPEELALLTKQALAMGLSAILHAMDTMQQCLDKIRYSNGRIELEMALIRLCTPSLDTSPMALLRRVEALEQGGIRAAPQKTTPPTPPRAVEALAPPAQSSAARATPVSGAPVSTPTENATPVALSATATPFVQWTEVVGMMKQYSMTVGMAFGSSTAYISGDFLLVDGSPLAFEFLRKNPAHKDKLREAVFQITGRNYRLGPYTGTKAQAEAAGENPLDILSQRAQDAGISVIEA